MYERSWLDFQRCESVSLEKWSVDDNNNMRHVTGVAKVGALFFTIKQITQESNDL